KKHTGCFRAFINHICIFNKDLVNLKSYLKLSGIMNTLLHTLFFCWLLTEVANAKTIVMAWKHMIPEVADRQELSITNQQRIGTLFQQKSDSDVIIISTLKRFRVRRNTNIENKEGQVKFFKLCVAMKDGKCLRRKRFGMWNGARGPSEKVLT
uniref:Uncharacterized protein n=1 Tax=Clytia hemisphaerica TaxID=252671 RepID=A0A7M5WJP4_9CNID